MMEMVVQEMLLKQNHNAQTITAKTVTQNGWTTESTKNPKLESSKVKGKMNS